MYENGVLLCPDMQPFMGEPYLQVLHFSKRRKSKRRVQTMDPSDKVIHSIHRKSLFLKTM